jgi:hypothetical protein
MQFTHRPGGQPAHVQSHLAVELASQNTGAVVGDRLEVQRGHVRCCRSGHRFVRPSNNEVGFLQREQRVERLDRAVTAFTLVSRPNWPRRFVIAAAFAPPKKASRSHAMTRVTAPTIQSF